MEYRYHIRQFVWNKDTNSFYGQAPFLDNPKTGGFRRFKFVKEITSNIGEMQFTEWLFESEDKIECRIAID